MRRLTLGAAMMRHPTLDKDEVRPDTIGPRLKEADGLVQEAARRGCDILCLPELFADPSQGTEMASFAEDEGGPVTTWLSQTARARNMALVATLALRHERGITNTGVFYDKQGKLVGRYGKVHLPPGEREVSVPGDAFPVFDLEGVRVGMQTCYDLNFPEGCRILALKGADVVFWPNMWGGMPEAFTDVIMKARAMENQVHLVSSAFLLTGAGSFRAPKIHGRSCILDRSGAILAEVGLRLGVAVATVDLDAASLARDATLRAHRRPGLYGEIVAQP